MIFNPIIHKELFMRLRFRQMKPAARIGLVLGIVGLLSIIYGSIMKSLLDHPGGESGRFAWATCVVIQYILVCLIGPAIAANSITQEKEQQTWEMLVFTRLRPVEIILGKLFSRLMILFLILALFAPLTLFCWVHYIVMSTSAQPNEILAELVLSYTVIIISSIFFTTFGLFVSWQVRRTLIAIMLSYTFVIGFLLIGTLLITTALYSRFQDSNSIVTSPLLWLNPGYLCWYALAPDNPNHSTLFLIYGLMCYSLLTLVLLWRMVLGFYHFSYDDGGRIATTDTKGKTKGGRGKQKKLVARTGNEREAGASAEL